MNTYIIVILTFLYFAVPAYISWRYDVKMMFSDKRIVRRDMKKQVFWYFWIPILGRFLLHIRDVKYTEGQDNEFLISLFENTVVYFVVGGICAFPAWMTFTIFMKLLWVVMVVIIPIEYLMTLRWPKKFMSDGDIDYVEYVNVFYQTACFCMLGYLVGMVII